VTSSQPSLVRSYPDASFLELATVFTALAVMVTVQLAVTRMTFLLYHPLWLDECLTQLLATDPSFTHALSAIRGGVETNPPTLYFFLWPVAKVIGGDVVMLRGFAGASMLLALVGVYAICRRFFDRIPSIIGMLVVAAHPIVIAMMFEARFYGPWLAAASWFAYAMMIETTDANRTRVSIVRCILAILLATVHWFGVISLCLIGVTDLWMHREALRREWSRALPLACGVLATLACLPFYLGQRRGLTVPTWMEPVKLRNIAGLFRHIMFVAAMLPFVFYIAWRSVVKADRPIATRALLRDLAPLLSLLIFPVIIAVFSLLVQPAIQDRYVIVAVAPLAVIIAALAATGSARFGKRWLDLAMIVGLTCIGAAEFHGFDQGPIKIQGLKYFADIADARFGNSTTLVRETLDRKDKPLPIVFWQRREQYPVIHIDEQLADVTAVLDFEGGRRPDLSDRTVYERDMNRRVNRFYPQYKLITIEQLRAMRRFIFVIAAYEMEEAAALLKDFRFKQIGPEQFEITLKDESAATQP
jgi:hypothetical protein